MGFQGMEHNRYREKKTPLNSIPESHVVELPEVQAEGEKKKMEQAKHCEFWWTGRVPGFTPPSFQSFAVARFYRVRIKMGVEIAGKKFESEVESHVRELGSVLGGHGV
ncbi:hypothetical protein K505DRAFT_254410 [Melanomma pulvis-pyrius CBS 109.77]|uniref:Uncharacterized protein n=1 Tax=Melanomma pulvis-pyrius CBS 109.77 TaxID=1314802 RepID=A0A6A6WYB0_9PLEO|nr:hypothetical protein K505DRAFT_254410 [Melanomma pulvis-pyrius CBS 109.77]